MGRNPPPTPSLWEGGLLGGLTSGQGGLSEGGYCGGPFPYRAQFISWEDDTYKRIIIIIIITIIIELDADWEGFIELDADWEGFIELDADWEGFIELDADWKGFIELDADWKGFIELDADWKGFCLLLCCQSCHCHSFFFLSVIFHCDIMIFI
jgi:hypothetical protein